MESIIIDMAIGTEETDDWKAEFPAGALCFGWRKIGMICRSSIALCVLLQVNRSVPVVSRTNHG